MNLEFLSKKVGGVPVVYPAGVAVLALAYYAYKMQGPDPAEGDAEAAATEDAANTGAASGLSVETGDSGYDAFTANPTPNYTQAAQDVVNSTTVDTNDAWLSRAVTWLIAQGVGAGDAHEALAQYLNGAQLSYEQGDYRDRAVKQFGLPPEPPTPGGTASAPAKRQFSKFPGYHTVQGTNDNTYAKLASLYYGSASADRINLIELNNPSLGVSSVVLGKGIRVKVPGYQPPVYVTAKKGLTTAHQFAVKNSRTSAQIIALNDGVRFPVKIGTKVRVA